MLFWKRLWQDESGVILSAEAVLVGTVGVVGAIAGLGAITHAVEDKLNETAFAIRSLDQSYVIRGQRGCAAWTAGSCYIQPPVRESLDALQAQTEADVQGLREDVQAEQERLKAGSSEQDEKQKMKARKKAERKKRGKKEPTIDESAAPRPESNDLPNAGE